MSDTRFAVSLALGCLVAAVMGTLVALVGCVGRYR